MNSFKEILEKLKTGKISISDAEKYIKGLYIEKIDEIASFDIYREFRTGFPEVIYAENKQIEDIIKICKKLIDIKGQIILSRLSNEKFIILKDELESIFTNNIKISYNEIAKIANIKRINIKSIKLDGKVGIITAGTSDIYIAEEAKMMIEIMGGKAITAYDIGISGFHRIFPPLKSMIENEIHIIIVVAGMEGTLPSVVASLIDVPVIGVPAPTGYGLGEKGIGALTTMLQSCAPGLVVVNIGNGFGAAVAAILFLQRIQKYKNK